MAVMTQTRKLCPCGAPKSAGRGRLWCDECLALSRSGVITRRIKQTIHERFWSKVAMPDPVTGCMYWTASYCKETGYGRFGITRLLGLGAHRMAWQITNGEIPDGMQVDHDCHNRDLTCPGGAAQCRHRRCCNPSHLMLRTQRDNLAASPAHPQNWTHCSRGHAYDEANTYVAPNTGWRGCRTRGARRRRKRMGYGEFTAEKVPA